MVPEFRTPRPPAEPCLGGHHGDRAQGLGQECPQGRPWLALRTPADALLVEPPPHDGSYAENRAGEGWPGRRARRARFESGFPGTRRCGGQRAAAVLPDHDSGSGFSPVPTRVLPVPEEPSGVVQRTVAETLSPEDRSCFGASLRSTA